MFADDDEGKDKGVLVSFAKKAFILVVLIVIIPTLVPQVMGVDVDGFCISGTDNDGNDTCITQSAIFTKETKSLVKLVLDVIRIGGSIAIIVVGGIKGLKYQFATR